MLRSFAPWLPVIGLLTLVPPPLLRANDESDATAKTESGRPALTVQVGHSSTVLSVAFSPDGHYVLTGSADNTARLWEAETGIELRTFEGHGAWIACVAFSPNGHHILTGSHDSTARLWNVETGREVQRFEGHTGWVRSVSFFPSGDYYPGK